jgi:hypothetical protein
MNHSRWPTAAAVTGVALVLLRSSYHHPRIHTLEDTLESSRFLNYYTRTRAYVEEHSPAGVSDASTHRQLKADCHWDARKLIFTLSLHSGAHAFDLQYS